MFLEEMQHAIKFLKDLETDKTQDLIGRTAYMKLGASRMCLERALKELDDYHIISKCKCRYEDD